VLAAIMHVAFRLGIKPSEVLGMTQHEFALCIAHMNKNPEHSNG
jgi:hypothetical protein